MKELTKNKKQQYQNYDQDGLNKAFVEACKNGHLATVQYLLTSPDLKIHANIHMKNDYGLRWACQNGHLDIVKYLLTSPELKEHADIHADNDFGFQCACQNGHLDIVRYLLTSPDLQECPNIHTDEDYAFQIACENGHLEVVKYLLTSPELKDHADIHADDDLGFQWACSNGYLEIAIYLLSFNGKKCIDFQKTEYNFDWAIASHNDNVIIAMMQNLKNNDFMQYIDCLPKIEAYNADIYEKIKNVDIVEQSNFFKEEDVLF